MNSLTHFRRALIRLSWESLQELRTLKVVGPPGWESHAEVITFNLRIMVLEEMQHRINARVA